MENTSLLKCRGRWKQTQVLTFSLTEAAPGRISRKQKSFRACQMKNLQTLRMYAKIRWTTNNLSEWKPKRAWQQTKEGARGEEINTKDKPRKNTMSKRIVEEQILKGPRDQTTKAGSTSHTQKKPDMQQCRERHEQSSRKGQWPDSQYQRRKAPFT